MLTEKEIEKHEFDVYNAKDIAELICQRRYQEIIGSLRRNVRRVLEAENQNLAQAHERIADSLDIAEKIDLSDCSISTSI